MRVKAASNDLPMLESTGCSAEVLFGGDKGRSLFVSAV